MWWKLLLVPVVLYLAIVASLWWYQGSMLFPAGQVGGAGPLPAGAERLAVDTPDGARLHGVRIGPAEAANGGEGERPLILGFGGNAWNGDAVALTLADLYPGHEVVAFHYRGYAPSTGRPSGRALLADALLVHDAVVRRDRPSRIVAVGFSIGSGLAARLAAERPLAGAILVTPFDSLSAVAADHFPWLPVGPFFGHEMPAARDLARARVPVAIVAAERDDLIFPARTEALRRRAATLVFDRTLRGAGHNDIYEHDDFRAAMEEALSVVRDGEGRNR